jgi:hypothetical protein
MKKCDAKTCACTEQVMVMEEMCPRENSRLLKYLAVLAPSLAAWWLVYGRLAIVARHLTLDVFGLAAGGHGRRSRGVFLYDISEGAHAPDLVVFGVGILRSFFTPERTRRILAGKRESAGT